MVTPSPTTKRADHAADLRKRPITVDTCPDLRFFPTHTGPLIHVPVNVSLPAFFWDPR